MYTLKIATLWLLLSVCNQMNAQYWETVGNTLIGGEKIGTLNDLPLDFYTGDQFRMTITSQHHQDLVGIGLNTPKHTLHLHSVYNPPAPPVEHGEEAPIDNSTECMMQFTNAESGDQIDDGLHVGVYGSTCFFKCMDKMSMVLQNNQSNIILKNYGQIHMFGTNSTSDARLSLKSDDANGFLIRKTSGIGTYGLRILTGSDQLNAFEIKQSNSIRFVVKQDGRVGIGTNTPDGNYMIDVAGKARACEVRVMNAGWCDYVFADNYNLMPISQLADYIRKNRHLPEMPSEAEVMAEGGFDVGAMNQALLKRSEENTLYIIALEEELRIMKAEIEALKEELGLRK